MVLENIDYAFDNSVASHNCTALQVNNISQIASLARKLSIEVNIRSNNIYTGFLQIVGHRIKHSDSLCLFCYIKGYENRRYKAESAFDLTINLWTKKFINNIKAYPFIQILFTIFLFILPRLLNFENLHNHKF